MGKHRPTDTREFPSTPEELETKRRVWPVAVVVSVAVVLALGIPIFLSRKESATFVPGSRSTEITSAPAVVITPEREPAPVPVTIYRSVPRSTKTIVRPTPLPTIVYRDRWHRPTPAPTVTKTIKAKPRPTVTITELIITCIEVRRDNTVTGEVECPS